MLARFLLPALVIALAGCAGPRPARPIGPLHLESIPLQHRKGAVVQTFAVSPEQWAALASGFEPPPPTAAAERAALSRAIAELERIAGAQTPTHRDRGRYRAGLLEEGQADCVDESANTTTYLHLLAQRGLLRHHEVLEPQWRTKYVVATHRTAAVRETATGEAYAIDSWWEDNGGPPLIKPLDVWRRCSEDPP